MSNLLKYKDYQGTVEYSAEDEVFYGKIQGIKDLVSFEGSSVKELQKSFHEAVEDYIVTCKELNKEPEKEYKGTFNVRIPTELHRQAAIYSSSRKISLNDFVRQAIDFTLSKLHDPDKKTRMLILFATFILPALIAGFLIPQ